MTITYTGTRRIYTYVLYTNLILNEPSIMTCIGLSINPNVLDGISRVFERPIYIKVYSGTCLSYNTHARRVFNIVWYRV